VDYFFQKLTLTNSKGTTVRMQNVLSEAVVPFRFLQSCRSFVGHEGKVDSFD
jgi:hypothetical protein